jgi:Uncharacterized protein conserved in bacteria
MPPKVILNSDETIVCPKCSEKFPLDKGITRQTMENYENEYEAAFEKRETELTEEIRKTEEKKAKKIFDEKQIELQDQLKTSEDARKKAEASAKKAIDDTCLKLSEEFELERKTLKQDLEQKDSALKDFREKELNLRKEKQQLEQEKANLELDVQRRLDEERKNIQEQTVKTESEKYRLREAEYKKKLDDAQKANEDLSRKLEQGSQQLQGEVLELELETVLRSSFPHDKIEPVKKGQRGADILHTVYTPSGQRCGTIIWEAKRAENWSDKWIQKLKDDQLESKAEIAVIVTTSMPLGIEEPFLLHEGIWVTKEFIIKPVAQSLRIMLIEANNLKNFSTGKNEKMEALYNYLCSPQFSQRIRAVVDTFMGMKRDLDQEKNAFMKIWKKREAQIERVAMNMTGMVGELEAISQESFQQLGSIEQLSLPCSEVSDS